MVEDVLSNKVIGAALEVHRNLGPGLLESAYSACMARELSLREIPFAKETELPLDYKGIQLATGYRADMIVDEKILLEFKVVRKIEDVHVAQVLTYLKVSGLRTGLIINWNVSILKHGIQRVVL
ncbi:GxxExxY protein [bacterium]|nr:GxxExxY protein [bacterium]